MTNHLFFNNIGLNPYQQIRYAAVENNTEAFRMWKSRMKKFNLPAKEGEYIMNGYALLTETKKRLQKDDKS